MPSVSPSEVNVERLSSTAMNVSWALLTLEEARGLSPATQSRTGRGREGGVLQ